VTNLYHRILSNIILIEPEIKEEKKRAYRSEYNFSLINENFREIAENSKLIENAVIK
jgi:hypothetical protein